MTSLAVGVNKRRYKRTHRKFSVGFQHIEEDGSVAGQILRGYTNNIAKGGMLIESRHEGKEKLRDLIPNKSKLRLFISIPPGSEPIDSVATVKWAKKISEPEFETVFFGVEYNEIDNFQQRMMETYIDRLRRRPRFFLFFFLIFTALLIAFTYFILFSP